MTPLEKEELLETLRVQNAELKSAQDALQKKLREMEILLEIEKLLGQAVAFEDLLQSIAESAREMLEAGASSFILLDEEKEQLIFQEATGAVRDEIKQLFLPKGQGIAGWVIDRGEFVVANDPHNDPRFAGYISKSLDFPVKNLICVPMTREGKTIGALEVLNTDTPGGFSQKDHLALSMLAQKAVQAIQEHRDREKRRQGRHLELVGRMVGVVLHDIRNPLSVVKGFNALLLRNHKKDGRLTKEEQMDYLVRSLDSIDRITHLCEDLLGYMRGKVELHREDTSLPSILDEISQLMDRHLEGAMVSFEIENSASDKLFADKEKLIRALINLTRNAREAIPGEGKVLLKVFEQGNEIYFQVQDSGPGIEDSLISEAAKPFVTTKTSGAGLGLFIADTIARQHNGALILENLKPHGFQASLKLPKENT